MGCIADTTFPMNTCYCYIYKKNFLRTGCTKVQEWISCLLPKYFKSLIFFVGIWLHVCKAIEFWTTIIKAGLPTEHSVQCAHIKVFWWIGLIKQDQVEHLSKTGISQVLTKYEVGNLRTGMDFITQTIDTEYFLILSVITNGLGNVSKIKKYRNHSLHIRKF